MKPHSKPIGGWQLAVALLTAAALTLSVLPDRSRAEMDETARDIWDPAWMWRDHTDRDDAAPGLEKRMLRHQTFMAGDIPENYRDARNGVKAGTATIADGRKLYISHCARCHEEDGLGGGEAAADLSPSPALLAYMVETPMAVDPYLLWTIAEGGGEFDTEMPAFKDILSRDEIWKIVSFMRAGFPEATGK